MQNWVGTPRAGRCTCGAAICSTRTTRCADFTSAMNRRTLPTSCTRNWASRETGEYILQSAFPRIDRAAGWRAGEKLGRSSLLRGRLVGQQIRVQNLARNGRRRRRAESAVLHQNRDRDLRVVDWRKCNEPGVIAIALRDILGVILLVLLDGNHLGGSG